jgi:chemosensory pili system protein ChpA (sensor histidine kinase/response regulator)
MGATVLLIDDDQRIRTSLGRLLRIFSYDVVEAEQWCSALELTAGNRPDVVITDLHMPECSGTDIALLARRHPQLGGVPLIALTATPPRDFASIRLFHAILEKPCEAEALRCALHEALRSCRH